MSKKTCEACRMSEWCPPATNNSKPWGNPNAPLYIVLDAPGDTNAEKLLIWMLMKLSLNEQHVFIDYTFRCPLPRHRKMKVEEGREFYTICWTQHPRTELLAAKSIVICGSWGAKLIANRVMAQAHGRKDPVTESWINYGFSYLLMNPAECVDMWRIIFKAAEEAGLHPVMNMDVPKFVFPTRKL